MADTPYARLPSVDSVLRSAGLQDLLGKYPRALLVDAVRSLLQEARERLSREPDADVSIRKHEVEARCESLRHGTLHRVLNATGVVVHTNLGRAPLPRPVLDRMVEVASGYCTLEYDLSRGARGSRHVHVAARLRRLLGAEDAVVVNNNAAAVLVALSALAAGRQVIVSRGELVEIGGSFRIPDVMVQSGARLVEVGTTNKTRLSDYAEAITSETALLLKVHRSNFALLGFTEEVEPAQLAELGHERGIPVMVDLGSGCLEDAFGSFPGAFPELGVRQVLKANVDLVTFSGDKLLGGPQAGILAGRAELIEKVRRHPLMRAVRPGKLTLSGLDALLGLYQWGQVREVPVVRMLCETADVVRSRCERLLALLPDGDESISWSLSETISRVGGGALPLLELPSFGIHLRSSAASAQTLAAMLRGGEPPVIGRITEDTFLLDLRTIADDEIRGLADALLALRERLMHRNHDR